MWASVYYFEIQLSQPRQKSIQETEYLFNPFKNPLTHFQQNFGDIVKIFAHIGFSYQIVTIALHTYLKLSMLFYFGSFFAFILVTFIFRLSSSSNKFFETGKTGILLSSYFPPTRQAPKTEFKGFLIFIQLGWQWQWQCNDNDNDNDLLAVGDKGILVFLVKCSWQGLALIMILINLMIIMMILIKLMIYALWWSSLSYQMQLVGFDCDHDFM